MTRGNSWGWRGGSVLDGPRLVRSMKTKFARSKIDGMCRFFDWLAAEAIKPKINEEYDPHQRLIASIFIQAVEDIENYIRNPTPKGKQRKHHRREHARDAYRFLTTPDPYTLGLAGAIGLDFEIVSQTVREKWGAHFEKGSIHVNN